MKNLVLWMCVATASAQAAEVLRLNRTGGDGLNATAVLSQSDSAALARVLENYEGRTITSEHAAVTCQGDPVATCTVTGVIRTDATASGAKAGVRDGEVSWAIANVAYDAFNLPKDVRIDEGFSGATKTFTSASRKVRLIASQRRGSLAISLRLDAALALDGNTGTYWLAGGSVVAVLGAADSARLYRALPAAEGTSRRADAGLGALQLVCRGENYCEASIHRFARPIPGIAAAQREGTLSLSVNERLLPSTGNNLYEKLELSSTLCRGGSCKLFSTTDRKVALTVMQNGDDYLSVRLR